MEGLQSLRIDRRCQLSLLTAVLIVGLVTSARAETTISVASPLRATGSAGAQLGITLALDADGYEALKAAHSVTLTDFVLPSGNTTVLDLEQFDVFAPDAQIVLGDPNGDIQMPRPDVVLLRGQIRGQPDSRVFLGLSPHGTQGYLLHEGRTFIIAEPPDKNGPIVIHDLTSLPPDAIQWTPFVCGNDTLPNGGASPLTLPEQPQEPVNSETRGSGGCRLVKIAIETDYEYTLRVFGGNTNNSLAYIAVLIGAATEVYTYELQTRFEIVFSRVWGQDNDPYPAVTTVNVRLDQFGFFWNSEMTGVNRNIAHMLTGSTSGAGGIAYLGVLCPMPGGYAVSGYLNGGFPYPIQSNNSQNWDIVVFTHEVGHNFGSPHTHDVGPLIDCCGGGSACNNQVNCVNANQGTIMSYCHTCPGGLANIALTFHQYMRDTYMIPYLLGPGSCVPFSSDVIIHQQPTGDSVNIGAVVALNVDATGGPPLAYQWQKDGLDLVDGGTIVGTTTPNLVITHARPCDAGQYRAILISNCSTEFTDEVSVSVDFSNALPPVEESKLLDGVTPAFDEEAGYSVAVSGNTAVVGIPFDANDDRGAAAVYVYQSGNWTLQATLTANDAAAGDYFGTSVAIDGDTIVVGAFGQTVTHSDQGAAYVFVRSGVTWNQQAKLIANDPGVSDSLGISISISGNTVACGSWNNDLEGGSDQGAVYVYTRNGIVWSQQAKLNASDAATADGLGFSVCVDGDSLIAGAYGDDGAAGANQGSAYVFVRSGATWTQQAKLLASDAAAVDEFGRAVSIHGNAAVVGSPGDDGPAGANQGSAYVFTRSGTVWTQRAKLTASDAAAQDDFGSCVAIHANSVVIGSPKSDNDAPASDRGAVYLFDRCDNTWNQLAKLAATDPATADQLGFSVTVRDDLIMAGAPFKAASGPINLAGAAYIFRARCPLRSPAVAPDQAQLCTDNTINVTVSNSQTGVVYQLRNAGNPLGSPVNGNGGNIVLSSPISVSSTQTYWLNVLATTIDSGCTTQLDETVPLLVFEHMVAPLSAEAVPSIYCIGTQPNVQLSSTLGPGSGMDWFTGSCGGTYVGSGATLVTPAPSQTTTYFARRTGLCGPSDCVSTLVLVYTPAVITEQPTGVAACVGDKAVFHVAASSIPAPIAYQWRKNFIPLSNGGHISGATSPTLTIDPVGPGDASNFYDVTVYSICNIAGSNVVSLAIASEPPVFFIQPDAQELCQNQTISLYTLASGSPSPTYQWRRNGEPIDGATTQLYEIFNATPSHSGLYDVVAVNGCFSEESEAVQINVYAVATGDGTGDSLVNGLDIPGFVDAVLYGDGAPGPAYCAYDMNEDEFVDMSDLPQFINLLVAP